MKRSVNSIVAPRTARPILRLGESALAALAAIPDTPELLAADRCFLAAHPPRLDRPASPLATAMAGAWDALEDYLVPRSINRIEPELPSAKPPVLARCGTAPACSSGCAASRCPLRPRAASRRQCEPAPPYDLCNRPAKSTCFLPVLSGGGVRMAQPKGVVASRPSPPMGEREG